MIDLCQFRAVVGLFNCRFNLQSNLRASRSGKVFRSGISDFICRFFRSEGGGAVDSRDLMFLGYYVFMVYIILFYATAVIDFDSSGGPINFKQFANFQATNIFP